MNPHLLKRLYPNASQSVLQANACDYGKPHESKTLDTAADSIEPKRDRVPRLARVLQRQEAVGERIIVRITIRKCGRQQDPDNAVWKSLVDQLRYCGAIPEDDGGTIKLETDQIRVGTKKEEGTEIEVIYPQ